MELGDARQASAFGHVRAAWLQTHGRPLRLAPLLHGKKAPEEAIAHGVPAAVPVGQSIDVSSRDESSKGLAGGTGPDPSPGDGRFDVP